MAMLTFHTQTSSSFALDIHKSISHRTGLHRLFTAAIVSDQFRETLLNKPEEALANGYLGQTFTLTDHEAKIIKSIRAETLTDFAQKVNRALKGI